ncbi:MAG: hypothetical protein ACLSUW_11020 [Akkermansia sp.]
MAGIGAFGRIWCSLYIAGYKNNALVIEGRTPCSATRFTSSASSGAWGGVRYGNLPYPPPYGTGIRYFTILPSSEGSRNVSSPYSETPTETTAGRDLPSSPPFPC